MKDTHGVDMARLRAAFEQADAERHQEDQRLVDFVRQHGYERMDKIESGWAHLLVSRMSRPLYAEASDKLGVSAEAVYDATRRLAARVAREAPCCSHSRVRQEG